MGRFSLALKCFFRVLGGKPLPEEAIAPPPTQQMLPQAAREEGAQDGAALQLLAILQKEGRLLDFLQEDIDGYTDVQVGAAVRNIHKDCRQVLEERLGIEPVLGGEEESRVTVEAGFDPARIRLIGNVTGEPPFDGILKHHGWYAAAVSLPRPADGQDQHIIAPAEVELS